MKGGALPGDPVDVFCDGVGAVDLPGAAGRDAEHARHRLHALRRDLRAARARRRARSTRCARAKAYLTEGLRRSYAVGRGRGVVDHLHPLR